MIKWNPGCDCAYVRTLETDFQKVEGYDAIAQDRREQILRRAQLHCEEKKSKTKWTILLKPNNQNVRATLLVKYLTVVI
jgi:hypothetical protein